MRQQLPQAAAEQVVSAAGVAGVAGAAGAAGVAGVAGAAGAAGAAGGGERGGARRVRWVRQMPVRQVTGAAGWRERTGAQRIKFSRFTTAITLVDRQSLWHFITEPLHLVRTRNPKVRLQLLAQLLHSLHSRWNRRVIVVPVPRRVRNKLHPAGGFAPRRRVALNRLPLFIFRQGHVCHRPLDIIRLALTRNIPSAQSARLRYILLRERIFTREVVKYEQHRGPVDAKRVLPFPSPNTIGAPDA